MAIFTFPRYETTAMVTAILRNIESTRLLNRLERHLIDTRLSDDSRQRMGTLCVTRIPPSKTECAELCSSVLTHFAPPDEVKWFHGSLPLRKGTRKGRIERHRSWNEGWLTRKASSIPTSSSGADLRGAKRSSRKSRRPSTKTSRATEELIRPQPTEVD